MTSRAAAAGLSTAEIDEIRGSLATGRKPKVMFTSQAGQIAGEVGQVVRLTDPQQSEEWLVVRFGRDELPFSPADLSIPPRGRPAATKRGAKQTTSAPSTSAPSTAAPAKPGAAPAGPPTPVATPEPAASQSPATGARAGRPAKRVTKATRTARPKTPATMTVTLAYEAGEWTVGAAQGSKVLAKPYVIRPAEALKMVSMLDVPGVHDAVEQIVTAELAQAQRRAEALRGELAEVEARLAELRGDS